MIWLDISAVQRFNRLTSCHDEKPCATRSYDIEEKLVLYIQICHPLLSEVVKKIQFICIVHPSYQRENAMLSKGLMLDGLSERNPTGLYACH